MKVIPLPIETASILGVNTKIILDYTDLNGTSSAFTAAWTSGTAQAIIPQNLIGASSITFPIGTTFEKVLLNVVTAFTSSGGSITSLTLSLGDGSSTTRFLSGITLKSTGYTASANVLYPYNAADTVDALATISGQTMASLNAGLLELYLNVLPAQDLLVVQQP